MGMAVGTGGGAKSEINITPLVDVVLVLLIIFMVVTPLVQMGYDLQIPKKVQSTEMPIAPTDQLILSVTQDESFIKIFINKEEISRDDLGSRLEAIYKGKPDKILFLAAERGVNYGEVMKIVDIARRAGGEKLKIGLVTEDRIGPMGGGPAPAAAADGATAPGM